MEYLSPQMTRADYPVSSAQFGKGVRVYGVLVLCPQEGIEGPLFLLVSLGTPQYVHHHAPQTL